MLPHCAVMAVVHARLELSEPLQTFMDSGILEKAGEACCVHPELQTPFTALLEAALNASASTMPQAIAAAVSQLGLSLKGVHCTCLFVPCSSRCTAFEHSWACMHPRG